MGNSNNSAAPTTQQLNELTQRLNELRQQIAQLPQPDPKPVCLALEGIPTWKTYFENDVGNLIKHLPSYEEDFAYDAKINNRVSLYKGDITGIKADGIVGASNSNLDATAGVSARIAVVAGSKLNDELATLNGCKTGESKVTPGYELPAKFVIHAVGPSYEDPALLESCYKSCLENMQQNKMKSLAFCCISTGINGYPEKKAVLIALKTVRKWMDVRKKQNSLSEIDRIIFCLYKSTEVSLYESWMQVFFPCRPKTKEEISTWQTHFEENEEILINRVIPKGEDFEFDKDINEKLSLCEGDIPGLRDDIDSANNGSIVTSDGVMVRKIGPCVEIYNEKWYEIWLNEMLQHEIKFLVFRFTSTGHPVNKAVLIVLKTVRQWLSNLKKSNKLSGLGRIIFCLYKLEDVVLFEDWMQVYFPCCPKSEMDLLPLPGYVRITVTEPDMLGIDFGRRQAKMPCGHVIGPDSITDYCRNVLGKGQFQFICPSTGPPPCNDQWEYFIVRHVARLTSEELAEFEKNIAENYLDKAKGMQRCPGCQVFCYRGEGVRAAVRCPLCTRDTGKNFDFCWWCRGKWTPSSSSTPCGNPGCDGKDKRLSILAKCPKKEINKCKDCPSIRGCPRCGILIEHKENCAHMACTNCPNYGFCFICLKEKKDGKWQCSYTGTCVLQPVQTTLPGSE